MEFISIEFTKEEREKVFKFFKDAQGKVKAEVWLTGGIEGNNSQFIASLNIKKASE